MKDTLVQIETKSLKSDFCKAVVEKFNLDRRKIQGPYDLEVTGKRERSRSTVLKISPLPEWSKEDEVFCASLDKAYRNYVKCLDKRQKTFFEGREFRDGGYYIESLKPLENKVWSSDLFYSSEGIRVLSFIWYLNDPGDGGEVEFSSGLTVNPCEGDILIFPSSWEYFYRTSPIKSDFLYLCRGWMHG